MGGWDAFPHRFRSPIIMRMDFADQSPPSRGQDHIERPSIPRYRAAADKAARFQAVHQPRDIRAMHDEVAAEFDLCAALRKVREKIQDIELTGAEVPTGEEYAARVPKRFSGAQQFEQCPVTDARRRQGD